MPAPRAATDAGPDQSRHQPCLIPHIPLRSAEPRMKVSHCPQSLAIIDSWNQTLTFAASRARASLVALRRYQTVISDEVMTMNRL